MEQPVRKEPNPSFSESHQPFYSPQTPCDLAPRCRLLIVAPASTPHEHGSRVQPDANQLFPDKTLSWYIFKDHFKCLSYILKFLPFICTNYHILKTTCVAISYSAYYSLLCTCMLLLQTRSFLQVRALPSPSLRKMEQDCMSLNNHWVGTDGRKLQRSNGCFILNNTLSCYYVLLWEQRDYASIKIENSGSSAFGIGWTFLLQCLLI